MTDEVAENQLREEIAAYLKGKPIEPAHLDKGKKGQDFFNLISSLALRRPSARGRR
jgi:hypothetical protein